MLHSERIEQIKRAADTPTGNVTAEEIRGMLGELLDELAVNAERQAIVEPERHRRALAAEQVKALHLGRRR